MADSLPPRLLSGDPGRAPFGGQPFLANRAVPWRLRGRCVALNGAQDTLERGGQEAWPHLHPGHDLAARCGASRWCRKAPSTGHRVEARGCRPREGGPSRPPSVDRFSGVSEVGENHSKRHEGGAGARCFISGIKRTIRRVGEATLRPSPREAAVPSTAGTQSTGCGVPGTGRTATPSRTGTAPLPPATAAGPLALGVRQDGVQTSRRTCAPGPAPPLPASGTSGRPSKPSVRKVGWGTGRGRGWEGGFEGSPRLFPTVTVHVLYL